MHPELYKRLAGGEPPQLLTVPEACSRLSCSRSFLYGEVAAKRIKTLKLGFATRITAAELERYVASLHGPSAKEAH